MKGDSLGLASLSTAHRRAGKRTKTHAICQVFVKCGGPVAQRVEQGIIIQERFFARVFTALHTVADAR